MPMAWCSACTSWGRGPPSCSPRAIYRSTGKRMQPILLRWCIRIRRSVKYSVKPRWPAQAVPCTDALKGWIGGDGGVWVDVTMPQLGETVTEGTITRWLKQVGEHVDADEPLFEVSTDKVDSEVP